MSPPSVRIQPSIQTMLEDGLCSSIHSSWAEDSVPAHAISLIKMLPGVDGVGKGKEVGLDVGEGEIVKVGEGVVDGTSKDAVPVGNVEPGDGLGEAVPAVLVTGESLGETSGYGVVAEMATDGSALGVMIVAGVVVVAPGGEGV